MAKKIVMASGKRKTATARATVRKGIGRVRINNTPLEIYQPEVARLRIMEPLSIAEKYRNSVDIDVNVSGGGVIGQANAVRTAIAKSLVRFTGDPLLRDMFMNFDRSLLVSDSRRKEPKKPLGRGARRKRQKSYR